MDIGFINYIIMVSNEVWKMMWEVHWETFRTRYFNQSVIYVEDNEKTWNFYTYEGYMLIKCIVDKSNIVEDNIMFVDRYITGSRQNFILGKAVKNPKIELEKAIETKEEKPDEQGELYNIDSV